MCRLIFVWILYWVFPVSEQTVLRGMCPSDYDPVTQVCCHGNVFDKIDGNPSYQCCGMQYINSNVYKCCHGVKRLVTSPDVCCGIEWHNPDTHGCCGHVAYDKQTQKCCGATPYNVANETCCVKDNQFIPPYEFDVLPGLGECCGSSRLYDSDTQLCCKDNTQVAIHSRGRVNENSCCGLNSYNTSGEVCCNKVKKTKEPGKTCCGSSLFDPDDELCCRNQRVSKEGGLTDCCNHSGFNSNNQTCYKFQIYDKFSKSCGDGVYHTYKDSCCGSGNNGVITRGVPEQIQAQACCGTTSYLDNTHICCNGNLHFRSTPDLRCCGTGTYNAESDLCCLGTRHTKWVNDTECCGHNSYNSSSHLCCDDTVLSKTLGDACCGPEAMHSTLDTCCAVGDDDYGDYYYSDYYDYYGYTTTPLHRNTRGPCCGQQIYNASKSICFYDEVISFYEVIDKVEPDHDDVCYQDEHPHTFNSATQECYNGDVRDREQDDVSKLICGDTVHNRYDKFGNERQCCLEGAADLAYFPEIESCCGGMVHEVPYNYSRCCGGAAYDNRTQVCVSREVRERHDWEVKPNKCGRFYYNPANQSCCLGELIGSGQTCCTNGVYATPGTPLNGGACCDSEGYNPDTHICCSSKLYLRNSTDMVCCGRQLMDQNNDSTICCDGTLQSTEHHRTHCTGRISHNSTETVCNGVRHPVANGICCGARILNTNDEICCGDKPQDKNDPHQYCCEDIQYTNEVGLECCGPVLINSTTDRCCPSSPKFIYSNENASMCCDAGNYDNTRDTCCQGILYRDIVGGECCGQRIVRDPETKTCCGGVIEDIYVPSDYYPRICCGGVMKNAQHGDQSSCCAGEVINGYVTGCCNGQLMIKERQRCCRDVIQNLAHVNEKCCANKPYDNNFQGCCDTSVFNVSEASCYNKTVTLHTNETNDVVDNTTSTHYQPATLESSSSETTDVRQPCVQDASRGCCSGSSYVISQQGCCNGTIYQLSESTCCGKTVCSLSKGTGCCGSRNYNPDEEICCLGKLHKKTSNGACCKTKMFNLKNEFCCKGVPIPRTKLTSKWSEHCCPSGQGISQLTGTCKAVNSSGAGLKDVVLPSCKQCSNCPQDGKWKKSMKSKNLIFSFTIDSWSVKGKYVNININDVDIIMAGDVNEHKNPTKLQLPSKCTCCRLETNVRYIAMATGKIDRSLFRLRKTDKILNSELNLEDHIKKYTRRKNSENKIG